MNNMKNFLLNNTWLKFISLVVAILLWIVCMNINNPEMTQNFTVPVSLQNLNHVTDSGMIILNEEEISKTTIYVKVKANRNDLIGLDASRLTAGIDFAPVDITNSKNIGKSVPVSVNVQAPNINYEILDYSPKNINVTFDELVTTDFTIDVETEGKPSINYEITDSPVLSPDVVTIKGAKSVVESINIANVKIDISGATKDVTGSYPINLLDIDGNNITDKFTLSNQSTNVTIPVKLVKSVLVSTPQYEGEPAEGFKVVNVTWSPKYIDIVGNEDLINDMTYLELPPINVDGAKENVTQVFDMKQILEEKGLSIKSGSKTECAVTFEIEEIITKTVEIDSSNITFLNKNDNIEIPDTFVATVTGTKSAVLDLQLASITGTCDLKDLPKGESDVVVDLISSNDLVQVSTPVRLRVNNIE